MMQNCHAPVSGPAMAAHRKPLSGWREQARNDRNLHKGSLAMGYESIGRMGAVLGLSLVLAGCGDGFGGFFQGGDRSRAEAEAIHARDRQGVGRQSTIWDLFENQPVSQTVEVNRYLWNASLEVLDFLPVQTVDPFSGVIVTGFGTPPGGGRAYRAAVLVNDPALDARSLNVALMTNSGPASRETIRAVEDAILTRARQLRIRDRGL